MMRVARDRGPTQHRRPGGAPKLGQSAAKSLTPARRRKRAREASKSGPAAQVSRAPTPRADIAPNARRNECPTAAEERAGGTSQGGAPYATRQAAVPNKPGDQRLRAQHQRGAPAGPGGTCPQTTKGAHRALASTPRHTRGPATQPGEEQRTQPGKGHGVRGRHATPSTQQCPEIPQSISTRNPQLANMPTKRRRGKTDGALRAKQHPSRRAPGARTATNAHRGNALTSDPDPGRVRPFGLPHTHNPP